MPLPTTLFVAIVVTLGSVQAQYCYQNTCKCYPSSPVKSPVLRAQCSQEPSGVWARNIKVLKIRARILQLMPTTLQDAWGLTEVDLRFCNITKILPNALAKVTNLSIIWLSHNVIETIDRDAFLKFENLRRLYLDNNRLYTFHAQLLKSLPYLQELYLQRNNLIEIPQLPPALQYLDISYNNISTFNTQITGNLLHLDVCMNPIKDIINDLNLKKIKSLCLSGNIAHLPQNFGASFWNLENFTFISYPENSTLNKTLENLFLPQHNVVTLYIGNTYLHDLLFLQSMIMLETLKLHEVSIADFRSIHYIIPSLGHVRKLDLERSPKLVKMFLRSFRSLLNLNSLEVISLKSSHIVHLPCELCQMQRHLKIDLQDNPLECDCRIAEIEASLPKSLQDYLILPEDTKCQSPQQAFNLPIYKFSSSHNCSGSMVCTRKNYTCKILKDITTTTTTTSILFTQYEEDNTKYYIILSVIIAILGIVITILIIMYIFLKKDRRVEPQPDQVQSFQQLQKIGY